MRSGPYGGFLCALLISIAITASLAIPPAPAGAKLEVLPDRDCYGPVETVSITLRNGGSDDITWWNQPPPMRVWESSGDVWVPSGVLLPYVITIGPGDTYPVPLEWNQTYRIVDREGRIIPPSYGPVPEGEYWITVTADDPPGTWGSARIRIDWSCAASEPSADAGPDLTSQEGDPVTLMGRGGADLSLGDWQLRADVLEPRYGFAHAVLDGRVYVAGGYGFAHPPMPNDVSTLVYDPAADEWMALAILAGPGCGGKPGIAGAAVGGRFYIFGAYLGPCDVVINSTEVLDETLNRWLPRADMPTPRVGLAVGVIDGRVYAVGGRTLDGNASAANEVYDPETDSWEVRPPMPTPRYGLAAAVVGGQLYAIGGPSGNPVEAYDPKGDAWTRLPSIPGHGLGFPAAAVHGGLIYLIDSWGLFDTTCCDLVVIYDPSTGRALSGPAMNVPRSGAGLDVVGEALVAVGGVNFCFAGNSCPVNATEVLRLETPSWTFAWDADDQIDSDRDGNATNDRDRAGPTLTWAYGDDGVYTATLTVTAGNSSAADTADITVRNAAPEILRVGVSVQGGIVDLGLRVAGRKWNAANLTLFEDGKAVANAAVVRAPGSPDEQTAWIRGSFPANGSHCAVLTYEPADLGGKELGANPVWLVARDAQGNVSELAHHTFNVQQSEARNSTRWEHIDPWEVDLSRRLGPSRVAIQVFVRDNGSDDLTFSWTPGGVRTYFNDGFGPDPPHSPWGTFPFHASDWIEIDRRPGSIVELTVSDDDGDAVALAIPV